jgi:hypothetical protein
MDGFPTLLAGTYSALAVSVLRRRLALLRNVVEFGSHRDKYGNTCFAEDDAESYQDVLYTLATTRRLVVTLWN